MILNKFLLITTFLVTLLAACAASSSSQSVQDATDASKLHFVRLTDEVYAGSQLSNHDLQSAEAMGIRTVINLRNPNEDGFDSDEETGAKKLGLHYANVVVDGKEGLTEESLESIVNITAVDNHRPILVHCRSGDRAGALLAIFFRCHKGLGIEESLALGRKAGMKKMSQTAEQRMQAFCPTP